ncbi:PDZ domain-containing protein [Gloeobacter kilaueensis]|uniref:Serine endoprotease n=1 Tax=Gloeobacter kilaueensis (strain ATCC BAA-2537 / CCAP 1431/1 / ULC 316 / JS1) TaxID=1183438 RepID=U5QDW6_GLOK1|nr:PDZ domain-containing protein [Gloeobacter kilaueensis]AGY57063.1 serine endoprotease [Gloeobacter kilaueensis JS1]
MLRKAVLPLLASLLFVPAARAETDLSGWLTRLQVALQERGLLLEDAKQIRLEVSHGGRIERFSIEDPARPLDNQVLTADYLARLKPFEPLPEDLIAARAVVQLQLDRGKILQTSVRPQTTFLGLAFGDSVRDDKSTLRLRGWFNPQLRTTDLRFNDAITEIAAKPVSRYDDVFAVLQDHRPGETVSLGILRDKKPLTVPVTLSSSESRNFAANSLALPSEESALTPLEPTFRTLSEAYLGWGNVTAAERQGSQLAIALGPVSDRRRLAENASALLARLRPLGIGQLLIRTEGWDGFQRWQLTVGNSLPTQIVAIPAQQASKLPAGTLIPVELQVPEDRLLEDGEEPEVTGRLISAIDDERGVPIVRASSPVGGRLTLLARQNRRLELTSLANVPVSGSSSPLPAYEQLVTRQKATLDFSTQLRPFIRTGELLGVPLKADVTLPPVESVKPWLLDTSLPVASLPAQKPDPKLARTAYAAARAQIAAGDWKKAQTSLETSLASSPSEQARAALTWLYEQQGEQWLRLNDPPLALRYLEAAQRLGSRQPALGCAYAALVDQNDALLSDEQLQYLRRRVQQLDLRLQDCPSGIGAYWPPAAPTVAGNYFPSVVYDYYTASYAANLNLGGPSLFDSLLILNYTSPIVGRDQIKGRTVTAYGASGSGKRAVVVRLRDPVRLFVAGTADPKEAEAVWRAAGQWQQAGEGLLHILPAATPEEADLVVYLTNRPNLDTLGAVTASTLSLRPRDFNNFLQLPLVEINVSSLRAFQDADRPRLIEMVALKQLGYALGLRGASDDAQDAMYTEFNGTTALSERDKTTLKMVFERRPDISRPIWSDQSQGAPQATGLQPE